MYIKQVIDWTFVLKVICKSQKCDFLTVYNQGVILFWLIKCNLVSL
jgi:hypothetical protein